MAGGQAHQMQIGKTVISIAGNAMNWQYTINIKVNDSSYAIYFDDWMFNR